MGDYGNKFKLRIKSEIPFMCISVVMIITILVPAAEIKAMVSVIQLGHNSAHTGLIGKIHLTFNKLRKKDFEEFSKLGLR